MRKLLPFVVVLVAVVGARADEKVAAPVPKAPVPPSIDGKYTLVVQYGGTSLSTMPTKGGGKSAEQPGFGQPGGLGGLGGSGGLGALGGGTTRVATPQAETVISKSEIAIEGRAPFGTGTTTMEYTLDTTKSPIAIDVETVPVRGKKTKALGVVEISKNRLVIALAKDGAERPKSVDEAEGVTVYYFQKAPPPPRVEFRIVALTIGKEEAAEKELNQLARDGFELVTTTSPLAADGKASVTTVHFVLKRTVK